MFYQFQAAFSSCKPCTEHWPLPNRVEFSILDRSYQRARQILEEKCSILKTLAQLLPEKEVISGKEIQKLVHKQKQLR